jgi:hypothetical protein
VKLQYRIELVVAGYINNSSSKLSIRERLQALHSNVIYWKKLSFDSSDSVQIPLYREYDSRNWEMNRGFFCRGRRLANDGAFPSGKCNVLDILDLYGGHDNILEPGPRFFDEPDQFYSFTIDPGQDIIARAVLEEYVTAFPMHRIADV